MRLLRRLALAFAVLVASAPARSVAQPGGTRAFTGARIFDGTSTVDGATIVVTNGRIVAAGPAVGVPAGAERVHLAGRFVMPGIINSHGHVGATIEPHEPTVPRAPAGDERVTALRHDDEGAAPWPRERDQPVRDRPEREQHGLDLSVRSGR